VDRRVAKDIVGQTLPSVEKSLKKDDHEKDNGQSQISNLGIRFPKRFPIVQLRTIYSRVKRSLYQAMKQMIEAKNKREPKPSLTLKLI
jgi:hypothetical protein